MDFSSSAFKEADVDGGSHQVLQMTAADYVIELGLEGGCDDEEEGVVEAEVQQELTRAREAWERCLDPLHASTTLEAVSESVAEREFLSRVLKDLGCEVEVEDMELRGQDAQEEAGTERRAAWTKDGFTDWYVRWLFQSEEDEDDEDASTVELNGSNDKSSSSRTWSSVQWTVAPSAEAVEGESWKCDHCRVLNSWSARRCVACESTWSPPHSSASSVAQISEEKDTDAEAKSKAVIGASGFVFGGATSTFGTSSMASVVGAPISSAPSTSALTGFTGFSFGSALGVPLVCGLLHAAITEESEPKIVLDGGVCEPTSLSSSLKQDSGFAGVSNQSSFGSFAELNLINLSQSSPLREASCSPTPDSPNSFLMSKFTFSKELNDSGSIAEDGHCDASVEEILHSQGRSLDRYQISTAMTASNGDMEEELEETLYPWSLDRSNSPDSPKIRRRHSSDNNKNQDESFNEHSKKGI